MVDTTDAELREPPTLWQRLGFHTCGPPYSPELSDDPKLMRMVHETVIVFDWKDRLRILLSGKVMTATTVYVYGSAFEHGPTLVATSVLPPGRFERHPVNMPKWP